MDAAAATAPSDEALEPPAPPATVTAFTPLAGSQRIVALDVVRGFALLGIFLMNIEWFSRPFEAIGEGIPRTATGLDWLASWFVAYFVAGKFWTIFSLLFGMGFAVMLVRAERAGREFTKVYLRRILALAVFGAVHYIFIWEGDILFSYAVGALALLIVLYGKAKHIVLGIAVFIGLGFIPDAERFFAGAGGLAVTGLLALYLRGQRQLKFRGVSLPVFSMMLMLTGVALSVAAAVFWFAPHVPPEPRMPLSVFGPLLFITGWLSWKYWQPAEKRSLRMAVSIYIFASAVMICMSLMQYFMPDPLATANAAEAGKPAATAPAAAPATAVSITAPATAAAALAASAAKAAEKPKKTVAEKRAEREKRLLEQAEKKAEETKLFTTGSYWQTVDWRARRFLEKAAGDAGFAVALVGMFLMGMWFVRSGVMEDTAKHLPFFHKLALYGLPVGIGLGVLSGFIAVSHTPGDRYDGWGIARGLVMLGNLPACLGYVGLVVTLLHSPGAFSRIRVLAPLGRMALTNYLLQSVVCAVFFYGFGLGHWGMGRAQQVVFVAVVYTAQIAFSHWWLARFRYGPMEWLWRGFTYRQVPPLRIANAPAAAPAQVA